MSTEDVVKEVLESAGSSIKEGVQGLVSRIDTLAVKLGVASEYIWKSFVKAMVADAYKEILYGIATIVLSGMFFEWSHHVAYKNLPHEYDSHIEHKISVTTSPCTLTVPDPIKKGYREIKTSCQSQNSEPTLISIDKGLNNNGWIYVISAILSALAGILCLMLGGESIIEGIANIQKAEYNAFNEIVETVRE